MNICIVLSLVWKNVSVGILCIFTSHPHITATMAPYLNTNESAIDSNVDLGPVKEKVGLSKFELEAPPAPPVADDYMYDFKYNHALPTLEVLGVKIPDDCNAQKEAEALVARLSEVLGQGDAQGFADTFIEYGKSFCGAPNVILQTIFLQIIFSI